MNRPKGYKIQPHIHQKIERTIQFTQEVLFIKKGLVRVDFYKSYKTYLISKLLNQGDVILLSSGGHGFEMLEKQIKTFNICECLTDTCVATYFCGVLIQNRAENYLNVMGNLPFFPQLLALL